MKTADIDRVKEVIGQASFVLIQLEIPLDVVEYTVEFARQEAVKIVLNPAPAQPLTDHMLSSLHMITPNEIEAELLTKIKVINEATARQAARVMKDKGVDTVVITMGALGAYVLSDEEDQIVPSPKVQAVDTTAAGDTFNGALVVGLSDGMSLIAAIEFANKAAAYSVTKIGAQVSAPSRNDIEIM